MPADRNVTMGRVIARAWSEPDFLADLAARPDDVLEGMGLALPQQVSVVARVNTHDLINLALGAPPAAMPVSAPSDIRDFGEIYRDPRLWSLNWLGRDPVATKRIIADPASELAKIGVDCPDDLTVAVLLNTPATIHLIIPPRPPDRLCTPELFSCVAQGHAPASLRFGRLFGMKPYNRLVEALSQVASQDPTDA